MIGGCDKDVFGYYDFVGDVLRFVCDAFNTLSIF